MSAPGHTVGEEGGRLARPPFAWLAAAAALGAALVLLFPDSYQQDGGNHFLGARWAWHHPWLLVDVWARPLFTLLYSLPAQFGYPAAKLTTVAVALATAWQTWRLAEHEGIERPGLVVPLLFLQPVFLLLASETMTEPLFALIFVVALRLHRMGRVRAGMIVASLMVLARPEGFFLALLWGVWVLTDRRERRPWWRCLPSTLWLATGAAAWWLAALALSGDPLYIAHNWPSNWGATDATYGSGSIFTYWHQRSIIGGRLLYVPLLAGLVVLVRRRRLVEATTSFVVLVVLHSIFWRFGLFGSAGYARYLVCVAPATALITLVGWNWIARFASDRIRPRGAPVAPWAMRLAAALVLGYSTLSALSYVDSLSWSRDARAVATTWARVPRPLPAVRRVIWSQAYMCIQVDCDPYAPWRLSGDRARNLAILRASPPGTLVLWDADQGPSWLGLRAPEIADLGYRVLRDDRYELRETFPFHLWRPRARTRTQRIVVLYR